MTGPGKGDDFFRGNGAGEMLVFSAADFEDFLEPRPDLPASLEAELKDVVSLLARNRWPFRLHATYDESITRFLNLFEAVDREVPFQGLNWFFDHCETTADHNLERVRALGGGLAIQHRMAYQGEYFLDRYGQQAAERTPPVCRMLELGLPVLPEWSPVKVFGGYGAPLDVRQAARAGVPLSPHQHGAGCPEPGCHHASRLRVAGVEAARYRYGDFFGLGCDCFAF